MFADSEGHKMNNFCLKTGSRIGSLSSDVFQRRTSTESEPFSLLICLDATKFLWLSVFTLIETICPRICSKSQPKSAKTPLPVDVRRSKTSLFKLPNASAVHLNPNCLWIPKSPGVWGGGGGWLSFARTLGPFIRGKIRRVLHKTRTVPFIRACLI